MTDPQASASAPASRVLLVYGTRPEAIKMAPLVVRLREHATLEPVVAVTGQHREMLDQVNELFGIEPEHDLDLMVHGAGLADLASRTLAGVDRVVAEVRPEAVVVQGDTSTAFMAALAAFYQHVPVVHLEAGLRTGQIHTPFPEEANRRLTAPITALHLAPTPTSRANLERETVEPATITVTGNTVIDALQMTVRMPVEFRDPALAALVEQGRRLVLVTAHRRESWGAKMREAMSALREVALEFPDVHVVLPMHRNRVVRDEIEPVLGDLPNVLLTEPLSYHEFAHAMRSSYLLLTDSGGVQEEAPSLGKPVLVMRESTERPEAVHAGTVRLVGTDRDVVAGELRRLLTDQAAYDEMANAVNPYGDGVAAERAVAAIAAMLGHGERLPEFDPEQES